GSELAILGTRRVVDPWMAWARAAHAFETAQRHEVDLQQAKRHLRSRLAVAGRCRALSARPLEGSALFEGVGECAQPGRCGRLGAAWAGSDGRAARAGRWRLDRSRRRRLVTVDPAAFFRRP